MSVLKKVASTAGPVMRVLIGAGAFVLLVVGLKRRPCGPDAASGKE